MVELLPEETYYWNYSRHLALGYLDHPPMVAWLIRTTTAVFGQTEFGVRAGALLCGGITSFFIYRLTRNLFGSAAALGALALTQVLPFFFLAGMLLTPDAPLTAAWAASLYFLERALAAQRPASWWYAGIALGLGLTSKYTILLVGGAAAVFMMVDGASRSWWRRVPPYGAALLALAIFSPVIIWNAQHDWASFAFQTSRRLAEAPRFSLQRLIASVLLLITPTGAVAAALALLPGQRGPVPEPSGSAENSRADQQSRGRRFLAQSVTLPLAVFAAFSLRHDVKLDWTGAPWTGALPLLGCSMLAGQDAVSRTAERIRRAWPPTLALMLVLYSAGLYYLAAGLPGVPYSSRMELLPVGWRQLSRQIIAVADEERRSSGSAPVIVGMDRYATASEIAFYGFDRDSSPEVSSVHLFGGIGLMYERWAPAGALAHRTLLVVATDVRDLAQPSLAARAARLGPVEKVAVRRAGKFVSDVYYRFAYDYGAE